jgi:hypothetical protein
VQSRQSPKSPCAAPAADAPLSYRAGTVDVLVTTSFQKTFPNTSEGAQYAPTVNIVVPGMENLDPLRRIHVP